ncbi:Probable membrane protein Cj0124c [hydrothermal vent metagenome]|uniref:Probable membrane protein Cj0124c n=1 Tax=hydrothermal vent metagenome TaxID=652676 RepID=A0A1W1BPX1_9ZZZZ
MYIKRYSIASFILMIVVGWYIYAYIPASHESVSIPLFGVNLPPVNIALLVILPMLLLYLASVVHMAFYSVIGGFKLKKYEKDYDKIIDALCDAFLLKEEREHSFRTDRYRLLGKVVDNSKIFPQTQKLLDIENEKLRNIIELIHKVKEGEVVNLKKLNLSPTNPLVVQNNRNRYKSGELSAEEILINAKNYDTSFLKEVFNDFVKEADAQKIMNYYKDFITKESLIKILERVADSENGIELSAEELVELIVAVDPTKDEYIKYSKILGKGLMPETRLKVFELLSEKDDEATPAYLYTAFDLEMMDLANEILDASKPDEYKNFRAYKALKECNKNYNIDLFV